MVIRPFDRTFVANSSDENVENVGTIDENEPVKTVQESQVNEKSPGAAEELQTSESVFKSPIDPRPPRNAFKFEYERLHKQFFQHLHLFVDIPYHSIRVATLYTEGRHMDGCTNRKHHCMWPLLTLVWRHKYGYIFKDCVIN